MDALRAVGTDRIVGFPAKAASALGTFLRKLPLGACPAARLCRKMDVPFSVTVRQHRGVRRRIEAIPEAGWSPIPYGLGDGADVAETTYTPFASKKDARPVRRIVRRVRPTPRSTHLLHALRVPAVLTDREGPTLEFEADHRRPAEIEHAILDLPYGVGLNHLPSGKFAVNGAWLAVQLLVHNLARWTARIGLKAGIVTTRTLRRRRFSLAGRLTRSARRLTLHLPTPWPCAVSFMTALARLRAIPLQA